MRNKGNTLAADNKNGNRNGGLLAPFERTVHETNLAVRIIAAEIFLDQCEFLSGMLVQTTGNRPDLVFRHESVGFERAAPDQVGNMPVDRSCAQSAFGGDFAAGKPLFEQSQRNQPRVLPLFSLRFRPPASGLTATSGVGKSISAPVSAGTPERIPVPYPRISPETYRLPL